jgi:hypothetical protein
VRGETGRENEESINGKGERPKSIMPNSIMRKINTHRGNINRNKTTAEKYRPINVFGQAVHGFS